MLKALPIDPLAWSAREIELNATDLMRQVTQAQTPDQAMEVWRVARLLEAQIAKVGDAAIARAEALIGT